MHFHIHSLQWFCNVENDCGAQQQHHSTPKYTRMHGVLCNTNKVRVYVIQHTINIKV